MEDINPMHRNFGIGKQEEDTKKLAELFTLLMQIDQKIKRKDAKENDRHN